MSQRQPSEHKLIWLFTGEQKFEGETILHRLSEAHGGSREVEERLELRPTKARFNGMAFLQSIYPDLILLETPRSPGKGLSGLS